MKVKVKIVKKKKSINNHKADNSSNTYAPYDEFKEKVKKESNEKVNESSYDTKDEHAGCMKDSNASKYAGFDLSLNMSCYRISTSTDKEYIDGARSMINALCEYSTTADTNFSFHMLRCEVNSHDYIYADIILLYHDLDDDEMIKLGKFSKLLYNFGSVDRISFALAMEGSKNGEVYLTRKDDYDILNIQKYLFKFPFKDFLASSDGMIRIGFKDPNKINKENYRAVVCLTINNIINSAKFDQFIDFIKSYNDSSYAYQVSVMSDKTIDGLRKVYLSIDMSNFNGTMAVLNQFGVCERER